MIVLKEKSGIFLLCLSGIFCFLICVLTGYTTISGGLPDFFPLHTALENQNNTETGEIHSETSKESAANTESAVSTTSAVQTVTKSDAIGTIIEKHFYESGINSNNVQINNKTSAKLNVNEFLKMKLPVKIETSSPQVLILHTHTTESYMLADRDFYTATDATHSNEESKNMIAVGAVFAKKLEAAKIKTIHSKVIHDYPSYSGSYDKSAETINKVLKENPSIKVVIDLHRDSIADGKGGKIKPVTQIGGKKAAQVMLVLGNNFDSWKNNFALAVKFHQTMQVMYPGLARPISLYNKKYNQNLSNGAFILEVGTDANTLEEALFASELSANALVSLLNTLK